LNSSVRFVRAAPELGAAMAGSSECANAAMERYARGDDSAFADVYDAVAPRVHAYLLRQTRDKVCADDLLQQTLLQMHRHRGSYATGFAVLPWAFAIARRLYIDEFRRRKTDALWSARGVADDDRLVSSSPDDEISSRELAGLVQAALARMPESQRVAFELLRLDGLSHDEAAQVLGTTVSAVKLRAFRAYTALRAVIGCPLDGAHAGEDSGASQFRASRE
jgi:RNA polymerase sigma-70 factor (ECF subfamily)